MYEALISFVCRDFSMVEGEVRNISDLSIAKDLINAGYIKELKKVEKKPAKKKKK